MQIVNEGTTAYLTASFTDKAGAAAAPSTLAYSLHCLTTGAILRNDVALTPGNSVEITLSAVDNAIQTSSNRRETKRVTVKAGYGAGEAVNAQYDYQVANLSQV